jgi:Protein of unknown function (DUF2846)
VRILAATMAIALLLCGCASGQQFKLEAKPDSNRALLYVYRPNTIIGVGNADVDFLHLDGRRLTRIRIGGYLAIPISPGRHKVTTTMSLLGSDTGRVRGATTFNAQAGSTIYLRYSERLGAVVPIKGGGVVTGSVGFEVVPESQALADLANTKALELISEPQ